MKIKFSTFLCSNGNRGEHFAVKPLSIWQKSRLLPIAELPDRPYHWGDSKYTKSWDKHIEDLVKATVTNWGTTQELAVDQIIDVSDALSSHAGSPWEYLFAELWSAGVNAVPVVSTRASASEQAALIVVSMTQKRSRWLLRHRSDPHGEVPAISHVEKWFRDTASALGGNHSQMDAVLDLGHIANDPSILVATAAKALQKIAALGPWRQVTLASGGFPLNLAGVQKGTQPIHRNDWELFKRVSAHPALADLALGFGDYGVTHVDAFDEDPRKMVMSANLRYTHWKDWHVLKGKSVRDFGYDQYKDLCQILVSLPIYMQPAFSQGDANYDKVANDPTAGPGNATQWRRDATNHHIHVVLHQLANLPEF
jgi:hypothetical protein